MAESWEELKSLLMKEKSEKVGLKFNIQKTKIMASGSITSSQIDGEKVETMTDFIFLGSKITADSDYNHEIKRCLLLGRKSMTNLDSILKSRDITLPTKVYIVRTMFFPVVMYACESWTIKKGWTPKNGSFGTVVLKKTLESPLDCKEIKPVNPKGINPEYSLEGLMLKLKLQYFGRWMQSADSLEETLMLGEKGVTEDEMVRKHYWLNEHEFEQTPGASEGQGSLACCSPWGCKESDTT